MTVVGVGLFVLWCIVIIFICWWATHRPQTHNTYTPAEKGVNLQLPWTSLSVCACGEPSVYTSVPPNGSATSWCDLHRPDSTRFYPYSEVKALRDLLNEAVNSLNDLTDDNPCRYDHNGNCQEHSVSDPCTNAVAIALMARIEKVL